MVRDPYHRKVHDVLGRDVVTTQPDDTLRDALALMVENRVTALPVVDARGHCVGILSATDLVELSRDLHEGLSNPQETAEEPYQYLLDNLAEQDLSRHTVGELMTDNVATVRAERTLVEAAREMLRHRVHRLPVVDKTDHLIGIISTMDILEAFVEGAPS
jgi:CBS domain-containing protein